jgi:hypothetical protein
MIEEALLEGLDQEFHWSFRIYYGNMEVLFNSLPDWFERDVLRDAWMKANAQGASKQYI